LRLLAAAALVAQVADKIFDVDELLLEVALVGHETLEELLPVREGTPEVEAPVPAMTMVMHQFTSSPRS
jgi:hypothetical protein